MKGKVLNGARLAPLALVAVLLMAGIVPAAMAQGPDDEGDVGAAFTFHGPAQLVPNPLNADLGFGGSSDLVIYDIEDVAAADLVVDFPTFVPTLTVLNVTPGDLLQDLVLGRDYQFQFCTVVLQVGIPLCAADPYAAINPLLPGENRLYIDLVLLNHANPLRGNGSLARIQWGAPVPGGPVPLNWENGDLRDRDGNVIHPCSDVPASCGGAIFPFAGSVTVELPDQVIRAEVSSEGGKPTGNLPPYAVGGVDATGAAFVCPPDGVPPPQSHFECPPVPLPAQEVTATRLGYLSARATNVFGVDLPNVTLLAGNVVTGGACEMINIADIAMIAGNLNAATVCGAGVVPDAQDFNNNCVVDIGDLALAAKNYGQRGTIDWRTGTLSCP
jgi:hypothetical protein